MSEKPTFYTEAFVPDRLIAGNAHLLVSANVTIASGQSLQRGAVLGKITASGKYVMSTAAASDGSQTPDLILADDVDATAGDVVGGAYSRGDFNANALKLGAGHTAASIRDGLRSKGIIVVSAIPA